MSELSNAINQKVIEDWVHAHGDYLYGWAYHKTGSMETAEDLVQDVFLAAVKNFNRFKQESTPKT